MNDPTLTTPNDSPSIDADAPRTIAVRCELRYSIDEPTDFTFAVLAARNDAQHVLEERLSAMAGDRTVPLERLAIKQLGHELVRLHGEPGPMTLRYDATVRVTHADAHTDTTPSDQVVDEVPFGALPAEALLYVNPSRYCEADMLARFAQRTFGDLAPGLGRVTAVANWIYDHIDYVAGSTDASSTAVDVFVQRAGVCRDFAHLGIALCRALGVPARYVAGYAVDLDPPDFHGFFEVHLADGWHLVDATRMARTDQLVRIASGRDAADAAFATQVGRATLESVEVQAVEDGGSFGPVAECPLLGDCVRARGARVYDARRWGKAPGLEVPRGVARPERR